MASFSEDEEMSEEEEIVTILLCNSMTAMLQELRRAEQPRSRRRRRRWWVRPSLQERDRLGQANNLLPLLRDRDVEYYRDFLRMSPSSFDTLMELLGPRIAKKDTRFRKAIPADHRLAQVIRLLAVGDTLRSSAFNFLAGRSTTCNLVSEVCLAIWEVLGPIYVITPSSPDEWLRVSEEFERIWNMPHCLGAIDGKHVNIECPNNSGSVDRNYKNAFSKSMLAISDAHYRFLFAEVGHNGSESDGGNFGRSPFFKRVDQRLQGIPEDSLLADIGSTPYFFVGDEAFPLKTYLMRPYARKIYCPPGTTDYEDWQRRQTDGTWRQEADENGGLTPVPATGYHPTRLAYTTRDRLCRHFIGSGKVPWQEEMIRSSRV
nr:uncharacterized protein LOC126523490 isoform X1 [Dermacentor andersoni]